MLTVAPASNEAANTSAHETNESAGAYVYYHALGSADLEAAAST